MEEQPGQISRRRVLAGVAWTTPAIVLAVSVPRAAASEGDNPTPVTDVVEFENVTVSDGVDGVVEITFGYGLEWASGYPEGQVATTHYQATVTGPGGTFTSPVGTELLTNGQFTDQISTTVEDVPPGEYTLTMHVWGQVYDPVANITYTTDAVSEPQTITVT